MKQYHEPIQVELGDNGTPTSYRWRDRVWPVLRVLDKWVLQSKWWTKEGEEKRAYLLVEARAGDGSACAVEIYLGGDGWKLARVMA
jgi:hypothetical protein